MRQLLTVTMWIGMLGALDAVSFDGGYRATSWQWAQYQDYEIRHGVREVMDKAFGK